MAKKQPTKTNRTKRRTVYTTARAKRAAAHRSNATGAFTYRGLMIVPTFVSDEKVTQLEHLMREYASRAHVLAE